MSDIMYKIIPNGSLFDVYSVVETNFGGVAVNFVKTEPLLFKAVEFAENQGWTKYKESL